jgi:chemotaxis protein MotB
MRLIVLILSVTTLFSACVSSKKYDELLAEKVKLSADYDQSNEKLDKCNEEYAELNAKFNDAKADNEALSEELQDTKNALDRSENLYAELDSSNQRLQNNYKDLLESSTKKSNRLTQNLAEKEKALIDLEQTLLESQKSVDSLTANLESRERKVQELEQVLARKDSAVQKLKDIVNNALLSFEKSDLSVDVRNGKVYVSLASQLLFKTGSTQIDNKGKEALIQLAKVLKNQPEVNIMVEGHTDTQKISKSSRYMNDNWDLSVMRATSVLRILTANGVNPEQIIAAGRGEFMPVDDSGTPAAMKKNRRTEIILTPKLDELFEILEN